MICSKELKQLFTRLNCIKILHLDQINLSCSPENLKFAWSLYLVISVKKHNIILDKILKEEKRKSFL